MSQIKGVYTAIITPFTLSDQLDETGLRKNIRFQIENGIDGIVALGTTGEAPTLSMEEKKRVVKICQEEIKGRIPLMVGTGSYSTKQTIENTHLAAEWGADYALVVTPYYNKPTQEGLFRHFKVVLENSKIPIMLYNIQGRTGQNIQTNTLSRLCGLPNLLGIKEASGNISQIMEVIDNIIPKDPSFSVMSGDDNLTLPVMALGGQGIISVVSNLFPKEVKMLVEASLKGDYDKARQFHYYLLPFFKAAFLETNPIPIKTAMRLNGMAAGYCRMPLCELSEDNLDLLSACLLDMKKSAI